jgi:hypothetical protein
MQLLFFLIRVIQERFMATTATPSAAGGSRVGGVVDVELDSDDDDDDDDDDEGGRDGEAELEDMLGVLEGLEEHTGGAGGAHPQVESIVQGVVRYWEGGGMGRVGVGDGGVIKVSGIKDEKEDKEGKERIKDEKEAIGGAEMLAKASLDVLGNGSADSKSGMLLLPDVKDVVMHQSSAGRETATTCGSNSSGGSASGSDSSVAEAKQEDEEEDDFKVGAGVLAIKTEHKLGPLLTDDGRGGDGIMMIDLSNESDDDVI